jgi:HAD superfamily hydrolase (TIGR01549 family)
LPKKDEIKWLFFDVGSTLVDESRVYEDRMKKIAELSGITPQQIYEHAISLYRRNKKGDLEIAKQLGIELPKWESQYEKLYTDSENCLKRLSRNYEIGIIANQPLGTSERLENLGVRKYIDLVIASAEEGVSKPDRRIFEIALERSGCKPENAVMIGDRIDNDIVPAKQLGMKTIWIKQGFGSLWTVMDESEKADIEVNNLSDILNYL